MKLHVLTPTERGLDPYQMMALIECMRSNIISGWDVIDDESLILRARNDLAAKFLEAGDDWALLVDSDIRFMPEDLRKMIAIAESGYKVVTGMYVKKTVEIRYVGTRKPGATVDPETGVLEMQEVPTGFLLVHRSVFETLATTGLAVPYSCDNGKGARNHFFPSDVVNGRLLSEDYGFSKLVREAGIPMVASTWSIATHMGTIGYPIRAPFDIPGWFRFPEVYDLAIKKYAENDNAIFVELGAWLGKSTAYMAQKLQNTPAWNGKFFVVDNWTGSSDEEVHRQFVQARGGDIFPLFLDNMIRAGVREIVTPIRGDSAAESSQFVDGSVDFVFVDAGHDYDSVKADISSWLPKIKPGGMIAGDDYDCFEGVKKAVDERFPNVGLMGTSWFHLVV